MKTYKYPDKSKWKKLIQRPESDQPDVTKTVQNILDKVRSKGDKALKKFTKKLDGVIIDDTRVSEFEIIQAAAEVPDELKNAINIARQNITKFHKAQKQHSLRIETMPGVVCWRKRMPIEKVGLYIPGGSAPLFSTVLMLAIPASIAGCKEIVLCTPPGKNGKVHPAILYTASLCGIKNIFKVGGAQAIAAMAYGTEIIPPVFKIFGPGNSYVTTAKMLVQLDGVAIDMPAGPSELMVIADETANPEFIASDLLSQAEHGPDSQVMLLTDSLPLAKQVKTFARQQLLKLPRKKIAEKALKQSVIIVLKNMDEAIVLSNLYAPEHLIIMIADPALITEKIQAAGSVFIGNWSPESAGDYASGTNHTLPTNGYAAMYSGVSVDSFTKTITYQHLTKEGLGQLGPAIMTLAKAEDLEAHSKAVEIRLKNI